MKKLILVLFLILNITSHNINAQINEFVQDLSGNWTIDRSHRDILFITSKLSKEYLITVGSYPLHASNNIGQILNQTNSIIATNHEGTFSIIKESGPLRFKYTTSDLVIEPRGNFIIHDWNKPILASTNWHMGTKSSVQNDILKIKESHYFKINIKKNTGCLLVTFNIIVDNNYIKDRNGQPIEFIEGNSIVGYGKTVSLKLKNGTCNNTKSLIQGDITIYKE